METTWYYLTLSYTIVTVTNYNSTHSSQKCLNDVLKSMTTLHQTSTQLKSCTLYLIPTHHLPLFMQCNNKVISKCHHEMLQHAHHSITYLTNDYNDLVLYSVYFF